MGKTSVPPMEISERMQLQILSLGLLFIAAFKADHGHLRESVILRTVEPRSSYSGLDYNTNERAQRGESDVKYKKISLLPFIKTNERSEDRDSVRLNDELVQDEKSRRSTERPYDVVPLNFHPPTKQANRQTGVDPATTTYYKFLNVTRRTTTETPPVTRRMTTTTTERAIFTSPSQLEDLFNRLSTPFKRHTTVQPDQYRQLPVHEKGNIRPIQRTRVKTGEDGKYERDEEENGRLREEERRRDFREKLKSAEDQRRQRDEGTSKEKDNQEQRVTKQKWRDPVTDPRHNFNQNPNNDDKYDQNENSRIKVEEQEDRRIEEELKKIYFGENTPVKRQPHEDGDRDEPWKDQRQQHENQGLPRSERPNPEHGREKNIELKPREPLGKNHESQPVAHNLRDHSKHPELDFQADEDRDFKNNLGLKPHGNSAKEGSGREKSRYRDNGNERHHNQEVPRGEYLDPNEQLSTPRPPRQDSYDDLDSADIPPALKSLLRSLDGQSPFNQGPSVKGPIGRPGSSQALPAPTPVVNVKPKGMYGMQVPSAPSQYALQPRLPLSEEPFSQAPPRIYTPPSEEYYPPSPRMHLPADKDLQHLPKDHKGYTGAHEYNNQGRPFLDLQERFHEADSSTHVRGNSHSHITRPQHHGDEKRPTSLGAGYGGSRNVPAEMTPPHTVLRIPESVPGDNHFHHKPNGAQDTRIQQNEYTRGSYQQGGVPGLDPSLIWSERQVEERPSIPEGWQAEARFAQEHGKQVKVSEEYGGRDTEQDSDPAIIQPFAQPERYRTPESTFEGNHRTKAEEVDAHKTVYSGHSAKPTIHVSQAQHRPTYDTYPINPPAPREHGGQTHFQPRPNRPSHNIPEAYDPRRQNWHSQKNREPEPSATVNQGLSHNVNELGPTTRAGYDNTPFQLNQNRPRIVQEQHREPVLLKPSSATSKNRQVIKQTVGAALGGGGGGGREAGPSITYVTNINGANAERRPEYSQELVNRLVRGNATKPPNYQLGEDDELAKKIMEVFNVPYQVSSNRRSIPDVSSEENQVKNTKRSEPLVFADSAWTPDGPIQTPNTRLEDDILQALSQLGPRKQIVSSEEDRRRSKEAQQIPRRQVILNQEAEEQTEPGGTEDPSPRLGDDNIPLHVYQKGRREEIETFGSALERIPSRQFSVNAGSDEERLIEELLNIPSQLLDNSNQDSIPDPEFATGFEEERPQLPSGQTLNRQFSPSSPTMEKEVLNFEDEQSQPHNQQMLTRQYSINSPKIEQEELFSPDSRVPTVVHDEDGPTETRDGQSLTRQYLLNSSTREQEEILGTDFRFLTGINAEDGQFQPPNRQTLTRQYSLNSPTTERELMSFENEKPQPPNEQTLTRQYSIKRPKNGQEELFGNDSRVPAVVNGEERQTETRNGQSLTRQYILNSPTSEQEDDLVPDFRVSTAFNPDEGQFQTLNQQTLTRQYSLNTPTREQQLLNSEDEQSQTNNRQTLTRQYSLNSPTREEEVTRFEDERSLPPNQQTLTRQYSMNSPKIQLEEIFSIDSHVPAVVFGDERQTETGNVQSLTRQHILNSPTSEQEENLAPNFRLPIEANAEDGQFQPPNRQTLTRQHSLSLPTIDQEARLPLDSRTLTRQYVLNSGETLEVTSSDGDHKVLVVTGPRAPTRQYILNGQEGQLLEQKQRIRTGTGSRNPARQYLVNNGEGYGQSDIQTDSVQSDGFPQDSLGDIPVGRLPTRQYTLSKPSKDQSEVEMLQNERAPSRQHVLSSSMPEKSSQQIPSRQYTVSDDGLVILSDQQFQKATSQSEQKISSRPSSSTEDSKETELLQAELTVSLKDEQERLVSQVDEGKDKPPVVTGHFVMFPRPQQTILEAAEYALQNQQSEKQNTESLSPAVTDEQETNLPQGQQRQEPGIPTFPVREIVIVTPRPDPRLIRTELPSFIFVEKKVNADGIILESIRGSNSSPKERGRPTTLLRLPNLDDINGPITLVLHDIKDYRNESEGRIITASPYEDINDIVTTESPFSVSRVYFSPVASLQGTTQQPSLGPHWRPMNVPHSPSFPKPLEQPQQPYPQVTPAPPTLPTTQYAIRPSPLLYQGPGQSIPAPLPVPHQKETAPQQLASTPTPHQPSPIPYQSAPAPHPQVLPLAHHGVAKLNGHAVTKPSKPKYGYPKGKNKLLSEVPLTPPIGWKGDASWKGTVESVKPSKLTKMIDLFSPNLIRPARTTNKETANKQPDFTKKIKPRNDDTSNMIKLRVPIPVNYTSDTKKVIGKPGKDYPVYRNAPATDFQCSKTTGTGLIADHKARCQVFHKCENSVLVATFICPKGTIYEQSTGICDWWYDVRDCSV